MRLSRVLALLLVVCAALGLGHGFAQTPERPRAGAAPPASAASAAAAGSAVPPGAAKPETKAAGAKAASSAEARSGAAKPAEAKPGEPGPSGAKAGDARAEAAKPGAAKAVPAASGAQGTAGRAGTAIDEPLDGSTYLVRMRDLAQRVDELKEQIRRSHTRLSLLSDTILSGGGGGGARAEIRFGNELSSAFRLTRLLVVLDGAVQYNRQDDTGALARQREIPIFSGSIPPGDHTIQVKVKLQGYGYGVFSYLRGYQFEVNGSDSFTVTAGKTIELRTVVMEKGSVTTPLEERPAIGFARKLRDTGSDPAPRAPGAGGASLGPGKR